MPELTKERHNHISQQQFSISHCVKPVDTCQSSAIIGILFLSLLLPCALTMQTDKDELKVKTPFKPKSISGNTISLPMAHEDFY